MGLDNIWVKAKAFEGLHGDKLLDAISASQYAKDGNVLGSFRGKAYDDIMQALTGLTLYRERISSKGVRYIAEELRRQWPAGWAKYYHDSVEEFLAEYKGEEDWLLGEFEKHATEDVALVGWW